MTPKLPSLVLQKGERALIQGRLVVIEAIVDLNLAMVRDLTTDKVEQVKIQHLLPTPRTEDALEEKSLVTEKAREVANDKEAIIEPLLQMSNRTKKDVIKKAAEFGLNPSTLYNWIRTAEQRKDLSRKERKDKGKSRFDDVVEKLISKTFEELTSLDRTAENIRKQVEDKIESANADTKRKFEEQRPVGSSTRPKPLKVPSLETIKDRLKAISPRAKLARLRGRQAAQQEYDPALGSFPNADFPHAVWQIDHVLLDIKLVDDIERKPIGGRPWLTIVIDVCSRVIPGFDYSLDPPGEMSTGIGLARSILPKENWLESLGSTGEWPVWGMPAAIHGDNAFRMKMLKKFCDEYKIDLIWRPVKNPRFGGHVERFARTFGESVHYLPGTTLSDLKARGEYDSEAKAVFTESEFQQWIVERILLYHAQKHSALEMPPIEYYKRGVLKGTPKCPATGLQSRIDAPAGQNRLQLDLMPYVERTVQRYGIAIDKIFYWHDGLRRWINAKDPKHPKLKRKFIFKRFKRGLRSIWFYDPDLDDYLEIPTRDPSFPDISIWELNKIRDYAKSEGIPDQQVNEDYIKQRYSRMREIEERATVKTKAARKLKQRRKGWNSAPRPSPPTTPPVPDSDVSVNDDYERVREFTEDD